MGAHCHRASQVPAVHKRWRLSWGVLRWRHQYREGCLFPRLALSVNVRKQSQSSFHALAGKNGIKLWYNSDHLRDRAFSQYRLIKINGFLLCLSCCLEFFLQLVEQVISFKLKKRFYEEYGLICGYLINIYYSWELLRAFWTLQNY